MNPFSHYFLAQHPDSFRNLNDNKKTLPPGLFEGSKKEEAGGRKKSDEEGGERKTEMGRERREGGNSVWGGGAATYTTGIGRGGEKEGRLEGFSTMMHIFGGKKMEKGREKGGIEGGEEGGGGEIKRGGILMNGITGTDRNKEGWLGSIMEKEVGRGVLGGGGRGEMGGNIQMGKGTLEERMSRKGSEWNDGRIGNAREGEELMSQKKDFLEFFNVVGGKNTPLAR